ncbi:hypothetical protein [Massilia timonae]|uniref:hypothetical protein n=1 Tax=Massilia timonae TaxID=47229 RepID=UPI0028A6C5D9|nr:hypothetical protein [Massilia timonae]
MTIRRLQCVLALASGLAGASWAALPPPSPAQAQAAAAKKAEADARAAKEKEALNASMDRISGQWRQRAAQEGWTIKPPPPVSGPTGVAASDPTQASAGVPSPAPAGGAPGTAGSAPATGAAQRARPACGQCAGQEREAGHGASERGRQAGPDPRRTGRHGADGEQERRA